MSQKELPARPNLDHLKNQAKELLKAHSARDPSVCERLRSLNRFKGKSDAEILAADLPLQDAQFVLAMEYGFSGWNELKKTVESGGKGKMNMEIEGLNEVGKLNPYSMQTLMAELSPQDLMSLLRALPEDDQGRYMANLSAKRRGAVLKELRAGTDDGAGAKKAVELMRKMLAEGKYALMTEQERWAEYGGRIDAAIMRELGSGPVSLKTAPELLELFTYLQSKARAEGLIAIDRIVEGRIDDPYMKLGLELAVDRAAIDRPGEFSSAMKAKKAELMSAYEKRLDLIYMGTEGIGTGLNPSRMEEQAKSLLQ